MNISNIKIDFELFTIEDDNLGYYLFFVEYFIYVNIK